MKRVYVGSVLLQDGAVFLKVSAADRNKNSKKSLKYRGIEYANCERNSAPETFTCAPRLNIGECSKVYLI